MNNLVAIKKIVLRFGLILIFKFSHLWENLMIRVYSKFSRSLPAPKLLRFLFMEDMLRFERASWLDSLGGFHQESGAFRNLENLASIITMEYHRLEKGLSLPNRRPGASQDVAARLIQAIEVQLDLVGITEEAKIGLETLVIYFDETPTQLLKKELLDAITTFDRLKSEHLDGKTEDKRGGYKKVTRNMILSLCRKDQINFIKSRHSIREYASDSVPKNLITEVVETALRSPSVCNRQAWSVYAIIDRPKIVEALSYQNGNRGFTDQIPLLFVVCADLRRFVSAEERNQAWIDGGLFSMTLMLAIHAKGLGSCPLNWSATRENDSNLRKLLNIPDYESVIMMISAGNLPEEFKITSSPRRNISSILKFVD